MILRGMHRSVGICQTDYSIKLSIFPLFWSYTWKHNTQANQRLTNVKEKWSATQFDVFTLDFIFFIIMSQTISAIKSSGMYCFFHASKLVAHVLASVCVIECIKWRRLVNRCLLILDLLNHLDHRSKESILLDQNSRVSLAVQGRKLLTDILVTSRNGDRKVMQSIRITSRPTSRIRKWNQLSQFRWTSTKVIPTEKT